MTSCCLSLSLENIAGVLFLSGYWIWLIFLKVWYCRPPIVKLRWLHPSPLLPHLHHACYTEPEMTAKWTGKAFKGQKNILPPQEENLNVLLYLIMSNKLSHKMFIWCLVLYFCSRSTYPWLPYVASWFWYRSAGLGLDELWAGAHGEALGLFGPLGLQSQLIGHLERLAQRQDDLIGQILHREGERGKAGSLFRYSRLCLNNNI